MRRKNGGKRIKNDNCVRWRTRYNESVERTRSSESELSRGGGRLEFLPLVLLKRTNNLVGDGPRDGLARWDAHQTRKQALVERKHAFFAWDGHKRVQKALVPPVFGHQSRLDDIKGAGGRRPENSRSKAGHHALPWSEHGSIAIMLIPQCAIEVRLSPEHAHLYICIYIYIYVHT